MARTYLCPDLCVVFLGNLGDEFGDICFGKLVLKVAVFGIVELGHDQVSCWEKWLRWGGGFVGVHSYIAISL